MYSFPDDHVVPSSSEMRTTPFARPSLFARGDEYSSTFAFAEPSGAFGNARVICALLFGSGSCVSFLTVP